MAARRAKIQIKPKIVPGISKRDSNRNGANKTSKEIRGEHSILQESDSVPSGTDKQSDTKPPQPQSAFSLRPKTRLRGAGVPRLHGSMDSMKHIPSVAAANVTCDQTDQSSEVAVGVATDQFVSASPDIQVVDPYTRPTAPVKTVDPCTRPTAPVKTVDPYTRPTAPVKTVDPCTPPMAPVKTVDPCTPPTAPVKTVDPCTPPTAPVKTVDPCTPATAPVKTVDLCTPATTLVKDDQKQPDKIIKESPYTKILDAKNAENSSAKEVEKSAPTMGTTSKPVVAPVISRRSRFSVQPKIRAKVPSQSNTSGSSDLGKAASPSVLKDQHVSSSLVQNTSIAKKKEESISQPKSVPENNKTELVREYITEKVPEDLSIPLTSVVYKVEEKVVVSNSKTLPSGGKLATGLTSDSKTLSAASSKTIIAAAADGKVLTSSGKTRLNVTSSGKNTLCSSKISTDVTIDGKTATDVTSDGKTSPISDKPAIDVPADKTLPSCGKTATGVTSDGKTSPISGKPAIDVPADKTLPSCGKTATGVTSDGKTLPIGGKPATDVSADKTLPVSSKPANDIPSDGKTPPSSGEISIDVPDSKILPSSVKPAIDGKHLPSSVKPAIDGKILPSSGKPAIDGKILPSRSKPTPNVPPKIISRRSRFALQPKVGARPGNRLNSTSSKSEEKPTVRVQEPESQQQELPEHLQKLSQEKSIGLTTVVVFENGEQCELINSTPIISDSQSSTSPKSAATETSSSSQGESCNLSVVESGDMTTHLTSPSEKDKQLKSSDETLVLPSSLSKSQDLEIKSPVSRRSKFQVRPKLGSTKRPENLNEEGLSQEAASKSTPNVKLAPPKANSVNKLINSEQDGSSGDHSPAKVPRIMKDDVVDSKPKEYPVTLPKTAAKNRKTLPLREKQKKPDLSEHPADKPPDRSKMRMRDLIYWNPISSPMKSPEKKTTRTIRLGEDIPAKVPETQSNENEPFAVPQVKIGADGNIVINEESLVISNTQPSAPISSETVDETDIYSNYGSFRKYTPKSKWSLKETKKFFLALSTVGTDFSMMSNLFPNKTRRDLKNKFKREERKNRWLIDKAIKQQLHFDEHLFEDKSESEEDVNEGETPAKKLKQDKVKLKKNNKTAKTNTPKRKQKKVCKKDFIIQSETNAPSTQEVVMEEAVQDDILIISENEPFHQDNAINHNRSSPPNQTCEKPSNMAERSQANISSKHKTNEEEQEVVGILMELSRSGSVNTTEGNVTTAVVDSSKTCTSTIPSAASSVAEVATAEGGRKEIPAGNPNTTSDLLANSAEVVKDRSSLARTFLQQMGLNKHINTLQDEIVSITEAEISNDNGTQKVILVEVRPHNQKQTVVHMYLVSPTESRINANQAGNSAVSQLSGPTQITTVVPCTHSRTQVTSTLPSSASRQVTTVVPCTPTRTQVTSTLPSPARVTTIVPCPSRTRVTTMVPCPPTRTQVTSTLPSSAPIQVTTLPSPLTLTQVTTVVPCPPVTAQVITTLPSSSSTQVTTPVPCPPALTQVSTVVPCPSTSTVVPCPSTSTVVPCPSTSTVAPCPPAPTVVPCPPTPTMVPCPPTPTMVPCPPTPTMVPCPPTPTMVPCPPTPTVVPCPPTSTMVPCPPTPTVVPCPPTSTMVPCPPTSTMVPCPPTPTVVPCPPTSTMVPCPPTPTVVPCPPTSTMVPCPPTPTVVPCPPTSTMVPCPPTPTVVPCPPTPTVVPCPPTPTVVPCPPTSTMVPCPPSPTVVPCPPTSTMVPCPPTSTMVPCPPSPTVVPCPPASTVVPCPPTPTVIPCPPTSTMVPCPPASTMVPCPPASTVVPCPPASTVVPCPPTPTVIPCPPASTVVPCPPASTVVPCPPASTMVPCPPTPTVVPCPPASTMVPCPPASTMVPCPPASTQLTSAATAVTASTATPPPTAATVIATTEASTTPTTEASTAITPPAATTPTTTEASSTTTTPPQTTTPPPPTTTPPPEAPTTEASTTPPTTTPPPPSTTPPPTTEAPTTTPPPTTAPPPTPPPTTPPPPTPPPPTPTTTPPTTTPPPTTPPPPPTTTSSTSVTATKTLSLTEMAPSR